MDSFELTPPRPTRPGGVHNNVAEFKLDLGAYSKHIGIEFKYLVKKIIFDLVKKIVERTPVDTGRAMGSWDVSKGVPSSFVLPEGYKSNAPANEVFGRLATVDFDDPYGSWYITNNLPYIEVLEFGLFPGSGPKTINGFSTQAPAGMVRLAIAEMETELAHAI